MSQTFKLAGFGTPRGHCLINQQHSSRMKSQLYTIVCARKRPNWHRRCGFNNKYSPKCANGLRTKGGTENALDDLRNSLDLMVSRRRFQLHAGRFYSPAPRDSSRNVADQYNQRPQTCGLDRLLANSVQLQLSGVVPLGERSSRWERLVRGSRTTRPSLCILEL